ncbi:barstar family protein [Roseomonas elaeocarpi]|uniref:Barstar family protein n=1 Tax=Roseomonas elaeocarpi TaxID=907779 RepID=A0ABV6JNA1_9PROT
MRVICVECAGVQSAGDFWQRYLDAAKPEGAELFGRNFGAFWDALEGGRPGYPGEARIVFNHSSQLSLLHSRSGTSFLDHLREMAGKLSHAQIELA